MISRKQALKDDKSSTAVPEGLMPPQKFKTPMPEKKMCAKKK